MQYFKHCAMRNTFQQSKYSTLYEELVSKASYIHLDMLLICIIDFLLQSKWFKSHIVYNRYDRYFKNQADYDLIGIWSVSAIFLSLPISCTDFNNVGVSQKLAKIAQTLLVKHWNYIQNVTISRLFYVYKCVHVVPYSLLLVALNEVFCITLVQIHAVLERLQQQK